MERSFSNTHTVDYHEERNYKGIRFHALNAGHVLGACMWWVEIAGVRLRELAVAAHDMYIFQFGHVFVH